MVDQFINRKPLLGLNLKYNLLNRFLHTDSRSLTPSVALFIDIQNLEKSSEFIGWKMMVVNY